MPPENEPATRPSVSAESRAWIVEQVRAGCTPETILAAMRASGWGAADATAALELVRREAPAPATDAPLPAMLRMPEPDLAGSPTRLVAADRELQVLLAVDSPRLVVFGGFLADDECDALVAAAAPRLARSETVDSASGGSGVNAARTSHGMFFERGETPLVTRIEARIAALLRWPVDHGEGLQVLHYRPGAEYRPHYDWFDPAQPGSAGVLARGGQRVGTLVMYLNTPRRGGATTFPDLGLALSAIKGHAVYFGWNRPHPSSRTLHGGAPVIDGEKWVATKWLRERVFR